MVRSALICCFMVAYSAQVFAETTFTSGKVTVHLQLSPMGTFDAESAQLEGKYERSQNLYTSKSIRLKLDTLKTGNNLRDEHLKHKHLQIDLYPLAELVECKASDGKFQGKIRMRSITQEVTGTYETNKNFIVGKFKISLKSFNISQIKYMGVGVEDEAEIEVEVPLQVQI